MKAKKLYAGPFTYSQLSVNKKNIIMLIALFLQITILFFSKDFSAILNIAVCIVAVVLTNFLANCLNKKRSFFSLSLISEAILIGMCVPNNYSASLLFLLVVLSQFIVKVLFSGYGGNIFSSIAFTILVLYTSFPFYFPENLNSVSLLKTHGNMLSILQMKGLITNDSNMTSLLNYFFSNIGVIIPEGYVSLLSNNTSTIPAFRYNLVTVFSSAFLIAFDISDKLISYIFIFTYGLLVWIFGMYKVDGTLFSGDILSAFCTTGLFFYAFFVLTESSTLANSKIGKIVFAVLLGLLTFLICGAGANPVGIAFSILLCNIFVPLILVIEEKFLNLRLRKLYGHK